MKDLLYQALPLITGIICWILGYRIGRLNPKPVDGNNPSTLKADLAACRSNSSNLSDKVSALEHELYELKNTIVTPNIALSEPSKPEEKSNPKQKNNPNSFDPIAAKTVFKKKVTENDLKLIEGIGPKIAELFQANGIKTWQKLSETSVEKCKEILISAGERYKIHNPGTWPKQAKMMTEGKWEELKAWTDQLEGGKE